MGPILNTSTILSLYAGPQATGTIHKSNPEHLHVFKDTRGDKPGVQSKTPACF